MRRSCRPWSAARKQPRTEKENAMTITTGDRKSTRLNSSHSQISYAVFCLKKKTRTLLVPNIKGANRMDFGQIVHAFDELVARARKRTISPDAFRRTTASLTNPATVGTTAS